MKHLVMSTRAADVQVALHTPDIEWLDADQCFIGSCPDLLYGGCHGDDAQAVFAELCNLVEEVIAVSQHDGKPFPAPTSRQALATRG